MSNPVTPGLEPAPLPWLGNTAGAGAKQAWSASADMLEVRYPFARRDFFRQMISHHKRLWWLFALATSIAPIMIVCVHFFVSSRIKLSPLVITFLTLEVPLLLGVILPLITWLSASSIEKAMRGRAYQITLSVAGVRKYSEPFKPGDVIGAMLKWANVRSVARGQDETLILPNRGLQAVHVPDSAFADPGAAIRFRDAAVALWQTGGNMNAVPEAVRAEFAPQPNAPPPV